MSSLKCNHLLLVWSSFLLLVKVECTTTHNVDIQEPFVMTSPSRADSNDGFGWAVTFHRLQAGSSSDTFTQALSRVRVLVGAPRGTVDMSRANRTGLVYSCTMERFGTCAGIRGDTSIYIDGSGNNMANEIGTVFQFGDLFPNDYSEGRLYDQARNAEFIIQQIPNRPDRLVETKPDQLIGSSLFSSGSNILACGSRWNFVQGGSPAPADFTVYRPYGICFIGDQQLENYVTVSPCLTRLRDSVSEQACAAGFTSVIANNRVYVGAPSAGDRGAVFDRGVGSPTIGSYIITPGTDGDLYYGYSLNSGFLTSRSSAGGSEDVLSGAIRYRSGDGTSRVGGVFLNNPQSLLAMGQQLAETFGYSVAMVDLNGDGYDELVAGAPMYSILESNLIVECGRVFIYYHNGTALDVDNPYIIVGPRARMRFGLTVSNAGDLNSDGTSDLIVSAPYEASTTNTDSSGAIYVYYGFENRTDFENQTPQRIHADDIVAAVDNITRLTTFGFSVSSNFDTDNNNHNDILVGGYENQIVTVLRTRPFAQVQVRFAEIPDVNLNTDTFFNLTITANYSSADPSLSGGRTFRFSLQEQTSVMTPTRLFFSAGNIEHRTYSGMLTFDSQQTAMMTVPVYFNRAGDPTIPYQLTMTLDDEDKPAANLDKTGRTIEALTMFPRFRLLGNPFITVNISDLCNSDGCQSDIRVTTESNNITIIAAESTVPTFVVQYSNTGPEEARGLQLVVSNIPTAIVDTLSITSTAVGGTPQGVRCTLNPDVGGVRNMTCGLEDRFTVGESRNLTISMTINFASINSEPGFGITVRIVTDMTGNNTDANLADNMANINFTIDSISDISVMTSFQQSAVTYSAIPPSSTSATSSLGLSNTLFVRVGNKGPSTIQNARVTIYFPARSPATGNNFFLYPALLGSNEGAAAGTTTVVCDQTNVNPENLATRTRRKRSVGGARVTRQATTSNLNCDTSPMDCTMFVCNVSRLTTQSVTVLLDFTIDERFFSSQESNMQYNLTALAVVEVLDEFQRDGDNRDNNRNASSVLLTPPEAEVGQGPLFYVAIILPIIIGLILIVLVGFLLYYFGFFRRKRPEDEEEPEPAPADSKPPADPAAAPSASEDKKEEISAV